MRRAPSWRRYLRFWRPDVAADVDDELRFHFEERVADLRALGLDDIAAHARAQEEFGDIATVRSTLREIGERRQRRDVRAEWWEALRDDLAYTVRGLSRAPGFAVMLISTFVLGLGVNAAMFSFLDRVFLRTPDAVADPASLRRLYVTERDIVSGSVMRPVLNYPELLDMRQGAGIGALITAYRVDSLQLGHGSGASHIVVAHTAPDYFSVLGVHPALGRLFDRAEQQIETAAQVVIISDALWRRAFNGDSSVLGATIEIDKRPFAIIGIAPPRFSGVDLDAVDAWLPLGAIGIRCCGKVPWRQSRRAYFLKSIVRLAPGDNGRHLEAGATTTLRRGAPLDGWVDSTARVTAEPLIAARGPVQVKKEIPISTRLAAVSFLVLLIACANAANLLLARGSQRRREIAVRAALGISRRRLIALLLAEGMILALLAGLLSLLVAAWAGSALRTLLLPGTHWAEPTLTWRVAAATLGAALIIGMAASIVPALGASRPDLSDALRSGTRDGVRRRSRLRSALVVTQVAFSIVLLAGAGLFVRSLGRVRALDLGYDTDRVVMGWAHWDEPTAQARRAIESAGITRVAARMARAPGVERVALSAIQPMLGFSVFAMFLPGRDSLPPWKAGPPAAYGVSPEFFATTGLRVMKGRSLSAGDRAGAPRALVVNRTMADVLWPDRDPIGECVMFEHRDGACYRVVGVVENARRGEILEDAAMLCYYPLMQAPDSNEHASVVIVRARPDRSGSVAAELRRELIHEFSGAEPRVRSMAEILEPQLRPWRLGAALFSLLGALALLVAAVGVYSVLAFGVIQRKHEVGVRMALGARSADVLRLVVGEGVRLVVVGVLVGTALALGLGRVVASLLYGVSPRDPLVLATVALTLLVAAVAASLVPAWRAARVDPAIALRSE